MISKAILSFVLVVLAFGFGRAAADQYMDGEHRAIAIGILFVLVADILWLWGF